MLEVENLSLGIDGRRILGDLSLSVGEGETIALFGPNGSGKTTLLKAIMGFPAYRVQSGRILFKSHDITELSMDERSRRGIGMAFQTPPVVRGVKLGDLLHLMMGRGGTVSEESMHEAARRLNLTDFLSRNINLGFSGGEVKRSELLQLLVQNAEFIMLDEPDSGVDLENIHLVGDIINELLGKGKAKEKRFKSALSSLTQDIFLIT